MCCSSKRRQGHARSKRLNIAAFPSFDTYIYIITSDMLKSIFRQGQSHDREATDAATKLLQKLADSFSVEDRRQAASDLRDVLLDNPNAKSTISSFGLETVCSTIRSDWNNGQVVRNCLESLAIVVDTSYSKV